MEKKIKIRNCDSGWNIPKYVVYRPVDGENWYWCSYDDADRVNYALREVPNSVFAETKDCEAV